MIIIVDAKKKSKTFSVKENPGMKDVIKIGHEINTMKRCGESNHRIHNEYETEVHKALSKEKQIKDEQFKSNVKNLVKKSLNEYKE